MCDTPELQYAPRGTLFLVYTTFPNSAAARRAARIVVEERLAACANLLEGMQAIYRWQGAVEEADETVCLFKTTGERLPALTARIRAQHPYEVPCIVALPLAAGHPPFLEWIAAETNTL